MLLLVEREGADGAGKIFDGVELSTAVDDRDADGIYVWIQQVSAVSGGVHPEVMDDDGGWGFAYVFADEAEVGTGLGSAFGEVGFLIELMGDSGVIGHLAGVRGGGFGQDGIEVERRKSLIRAGFVGSGKEILLGYREVVFRGDGVPGMESCGCEERQEKRFRQ